MTRREPLLSWTEIAASLIVAFGVTAGWTWALDLGFGWSLGLMLVATIVTLAWRQGARA